MKTFILIAFVAGSSVVAEFNDEGACIMAGNRISQAAAGQATTICTEKAIETPLAEVPRPSARIIRVFPERSTPDPYAPR